MAFMKYLRLNGIDLPLPDSYDIDLSAVEADTKGETEAGTTQRDVVREEVVNITASFSVSAKYLQIISDLSKIDKLEVSYFNPHELKLKQTQMYMTGFKAKLEKDTSKKGLWSVSFSLNEF